MKTESRIQSEIIQYQKDVRKILDRVDELGYYTDELETQLTIYNTAVSVLNWVLREDK